MYVYGACVHAAVHIQVQVNPTDNENPEGIRVWKLGLTQDYSWKLGLTQDYRRRIWILI